MELMELTHSRHFKSLSISKGFREAHVLHMPALRGAHV